MMGRGHLVIQLQGLVVEGGGILVAVGLSQPVGQPGFNHRASAFKVMGFFQPKKSLLGLVDIAIKVSQKVGP